MLRQIVNTADAPQSVFFSQAIKIGAMVYVSGMTGFDPKTNQSAGPTIEQQTRQALLNCSSILQEAGLSLDHVVDVLVLLAKPEHFAGLNEEYAKFFPNNPPARAVAKLGVEVANALVSIKMTAWVPQ